MKIIFKSRVYKHYKFIGVYKKETSTIIIQKDLKLRDKIFTIIHEFGHYLIDKFNLGKSWDIVFDFIDVLLDGCWGNDKAREKQFKWLIKYYYGKK